MEYREIGKTGIRASVVGLGAEHLDNRPWREVEATVHAALEQGINIMDLFMPGDEVRRNVGKALGKKRSQMLIQGHIGSTDVGQQYDISRDLDTCRKYFENLLRDLGTDYIDLGMLFFIDSLEDFQKVFHSEILTYAQRLKQQGTIRAIGASSHNPEIAKMVVESGEVDLIMFSINPAFDRMSPQLDLDTMVEEAFQKDERQIHPSRTALYQLCASKGVGITVMKTLGAGKLLSPEHTPFRQPLTVAQCIHYALSRPGVASALVGCRTPEEVAHAAAYCATPEEELDYAGIISSGMDSFNGSCVYCNHCLPCPSGIDIASVNKYLDIAQLTPAAVPPSIQQHYRALGSHGSDCVQCGSCHTRCPFGVDIMGRMEQADALFGM